MWRWADEQGEQRLVAAEELRTAIANGVLPSSTLVWREGMSAWLPASAVPEFAPQGGSGEESRTAEKPSEATNASSTPTNAAAVGPARSTLQGLAAREMFAKVKGEEKDPSKEKRTPSVAPPRPATSGAKPPLVKTLRQPYGPPIPAAPRLPSEAAPKAAVAPRPLGARTPGPAAVARPAPPVQLPKAAPAVRPPSTSAIDKDWSITDDETTNVPGKTATTTARPEPPVETPARDAPAPSPPAPAQPSRGSVVRTSPPPSPHAERRPTEETTESTTFQFAKNTLSLRAVKPPVMDEGESDENAPPPQATANAPRNEPPPGLMESYAKQPVKTYTNSGDDPPPTAPSADLGLSTEDLVPAFAGSTVRLPALPESALLPAPPKMREPTATTMLPMEFQEDAPAKDASKQPHEVSRTIRLAADFLSRVLSPGRGTKTAVIDPDDNEVRNALMQMKPPPLPPPASAFPGGKESGQFVQLPPGTPHAATSLAMRAVKPPTQEAPPQLPLNALLMSGGLLITMVIGAFFVGRCSVKPSASNTSTARAGIGGIARALQDKLPGPPKPCWVVKQSTRWAPIVSKSVPFEMLALVSGKIAIGYAKNEDEAVGLEVTPTTGQVDEDYVDKAKSEIARVTPLAKGFFISTAEPPGSLKSLIPVNVEKPFYLGISDKHVAWADQPSGAANRLWALSDDEVPGGIHVLSLGDRGVLAALRVGSSRQRKVFAGLVGADRKPITNLVNVVGSGGLAGEPMVGSNGREVAVVFGDQASEQGAWKVRIGHAPMGKIPGTTTVFEAPAGGPGGNADYPSIGGLSDGRWVLVWTEGPPSTKVVRAQTFAPSFTPLGDPIVLSPPAGNYGSSMVGVIGNHVTVVFVAKGRSNNELWGSVLQCG